MLKKEIEICGKKVPFRSSATIPRLYRAKFKRDIFKDLSKLEKSYKGKTGLTSLICSPSMRYCLKSSSCGARTWWRRWSLKKTSPK